VFCRPQKERRAKLAQPNAQPRSGTRSWTNDRTTSRARGIHDPLRKGLVEMGIPVRSAVLQCVGQERLGNSRRTRSDDGGHPQFPERGSMAGDFEMGTSVHHSLTHTFFSFGSEDQTFLFALVRNSDPYLAKFRGKPGQLSPKARLLMFAGWLLPSRFKSVQSLPPSQALFLPP